MLVLLSIDDATRTLGKDLFRLAWPRWYFEELSTPDVRPDSLTVDRNQDWLMRAMPQIAAEIWVRYVDCALAKEVGYELPTDPHPSAEGVSAMVGCLR